jgi:hypothetical protein
MPFVCSLGRSLTFPRPLGGMLGFGLLGRNPQPTELITRKYCLPDGRQVQTKFLALLLYCPIPLHKFARRKYYILASDASF